MLDRFFADQRAGGGWAPSWARGYSSLDATCFRLAQAEQLGVDLAIPRLARAVRFLERRQSSNGSWQEDLSVASLAPVWARPGHLAATLYVTANCGFWLAFFDRQCDGAHRASRFLKENLTEEGALPTYLHAHWLAAGLWTLAQMKDESERVMSYLGRRIQDLASSNLAWMIVTLRLAGVPANHGLLEQAVSLLRLQQAEDGRWPSEDGPTFHVHSTLEALRALQACDCLERGWMPGDPVTRMDGVLAPSRDRTLPPRSRRPLARRRVVWVRGDDRPNSCRSSGGEIADPDGRPPAPASRLTGAPDAAVEGDRAMTRHEPGLHQVIREVTVRAAGRPTGLASWRCGIDE